MISADDARLNYVSGSAYDLAEQLGESGIIRLLEIVCAAYARVYDSDSVTIVMNEDEITEELFKEVQCGWRESSIPISLIPINQKIDRGLASNVGKLPSIDFCFRDRFVKEVFFGFECKNLGEGDSRLSSEYIDNGLCRYIEGKYCSKSSAGSMIGYVRFGNISTVIQDIKNKVDVESVASLMCIDQPIGSFNAHYTSTHTRQRGLPKIIIHHLFFDFA